MTTEILTRRPTGENVITIRIPVLVDAEETKAIPFGEPIPGGTSFISSDGTKEYFLPPVVPASRELLRQPDPPKNHILFQRKDSVPVPGDNLGIRRIRAELAAAAPTPIREPFRMRV